LDLSSFDRIVAMDNFVAKRLKEKTVVSNLEVWRISDPYGDDFEQYRRTLRQVQRQILRLKRDML
jgi:protein-tyrosine-phosphatase